MKLQRPPCRQRTVRHQLLQQLSVIKLAELGTFHTTALAKRVKTFLDNFHELALVNCIIIHSFAPMFF